MKKVTYTIENLNNRVNKAFNELDYANDVNMFNSYKMLFLWWMEENTDEKMENLKKSEYVDFLDFVAATSMSIVQIMRGKTEFDFDNIHRGDHNFNSSMGDKRNMVKFYIDVDGIKIQKHNKILKEYSLDLIDYIFACLTMNVTGAVAFSKYNG